MFLGSQKLISNLGLTLWDPNLVRTGPNLTTLVPFRKPFILAIHWYQTGYNWTILTNKVMAILPNKFHTDVPTYVKTSSLHINKRRF